MKRLATLVLTYNQPTLTTRMVEQLPGCIIVDNGSNPPQAGNFQILRTPTNGYFSGGWNWAMKFMGDFDFVWMLNSDIEDISMSMGNHLLDLMDQIGEQCAVVSPSFNSPHEHMQPHAGSNSRGVAWIDWCCPIVRTSWWKKVGGFDPRFVGYGADLLWCKQAFDLGALFVVSDEYRVNHLGSVTALSEGLQQVQGNVEEMNRLLRLHYGYDSWTSIFG